MDQIEPLLGEAKEAWLAKKKAANEGFKRIKNKEAVSHWRIKAVLEDILFLVKSFDNVSFSFTYGDGNVTAHLLAQWAIFLNWSGPIPISNLLPMLAQGLDRDGHRLSLDCIAFGSSYK